MIDLREQDRAQICQLAQEQLSPGSEIWAYGSRVKGCNHEGSDLDLVVHFPARQECERTEQQLNAFIQALQDSTVPILVQVFAWEAMPESFKKNILDSYQVLVKVSESPSNPQYK